MNCPQCGRSLAGELEFEWEELSMGDGVYLMTAYAPVLTTKDCPWCQYVFTEEQIQSYERAYGEEGPPDPYDE